MLLGPLPIGFELDYITPYDIIINHLFSFIFFPTHYKVDISTYVGFRMVVRFRNNDYVDFTYKCIYTDHPFPFNEHKLDATQSIYIIYILHST